MFEIVEASGKEIFAMKVWLSALKGLEKLTSELVYAVTAGEGCRRSLSKQLTTGAAGYCATKPSG